MIVLLGKKRWLAVTLTFLISVEIFAFSSMPGGRGVGGTNSIAIIYHLVVFFLFSFFLLSAIKGKQKLNIKHFLFALIISLLYSLSDEFHQSFVSGRDSSFRDIIINNTGIFLSVLLHFWINKKEVK